MELLEQVRHELGPVAVIGELNFVDMLPKTRSGKIMRRVLKAVIQETQSGRHHHDRRRRFSRRSEASLAPDESGTRRAGRTGRATRRESVLKA